MNSSCTAAKYFGEYNIPEIHATDSWQGWDALIFNKTQNLTRFARNIGIATFFALSPVTAIHDPWLHEKKRRDAVVTISVYQEVIGRIVSRSEALQLAHQILIDAERERLAVAEFEAARGIQWEERE
ncbi:MAG TPA: hypothetical protein ENG83_13250 [Nitrospirae bacterium]|nr:hypothetical protein BMS3Abin06_01811 [bacterium BMS3Abin06]HDH13142.1 hypothetical protein [Nitrospirota bacterium]HDZ03302.1 hypothetical protein [Nitrospirota bacterium]